MNANWEYDGGKPIETPINFNDIDIKNNFEITINKGKKSESFYLLGCYFGRLYLLSQDNLDYTKLVEITEMDFID